jgi:hypothetical protein
MKIPIYSLCRCWASSSASTCPTPSSGTSSKRTWAMSRSATHIATCPVFCVQWPRWHALTAVWPSSEISLYAFDLTNFSANLTIAPRAFIDRNGITLLLEGDVGAHFWRKNRTYNILSATGQLRVGVGKSGISFENAALLKVILDKTTFSPFASIQRRPVGWSRLQGVQGRHGRHGGWRRTQADQFSDPTRHLAQNPTATAPGGQPQRLAHPRCQ